MTIQYIAVPVGGTTINSYTLYNTHGRTFVMTELKTNVTGGSGQPINRTSRHIVSADVSAAGGATPTDAASGTVLAIINKNGHVTPICDPTP